MTEYEKTYKEFLDEAGEKLTIIHNEKGYITSDDINEVLGFYYLGPNQTYFFEGEIFDKRDIWD